MRHFYLLFLICGFFTSSFAQTSHKLGLLLHEKMKQPEYAHSSRQKNLMVQGDPSQIKALVAQYGGVFKFAAGDISSISVPYRNLIAFSREQAVKRLEGNEVKGMSFMDSARIKNNVDSVQNGYAPLVQAYKGAGVLVGIIDGGIYFRHQDFKRPNGNTRIRYIWDQVSTQAASPSPYMYGSEWDSTAINAGTCRHIEPASDQGHGTNVAGIAAGNGSSVASNPFLNNRYTGVAPEADLIVVSVDNSRNDYLQTIADAVDYIFRKADLLGMPCVVNTSVGTYYGPHDGSELAVLAMENLLAAKNGRVLVAAAGNGGNVKHHLSYTLSPTDSLFTWFSYNTSSHNIYFDLWADTSQFKAANFAIGCDNSTAAFLKRTRYYNALTDFNPAQGSTVQIDDSLFNGSTLLGTYSIATTLYNNLYHVEFLVNPLNTTYNWRLQTLGTGTFDLWASKSLIGTANPVLAPLPAGFTSPNYRYADTLKTIVSGWQCSDKVITVANYSNRANYLTKDSVLIDLTVSPYFETVGGLASTSSLGPTRDGRIKPDIAATGTTTISTGDSTYISLLIGSGNGYKVGYGSKHTRNGGTSMSSPLVAGVAALYLQKSPHASYNEVKQVLQATAKHDVFTTYVIPNVQFGWGKVNAFQALTFNVVYGCMDTSSYNYNPLATIDTGGCIAKVYGCTDTGSINYNAAANTDNGTCIPKVYGCTDTGSINYNHLANVDNGSCIAKVYGCTDTGSINYNHLANVNNGSCIPKIYGCTDTGSVNYNHLANADNGLCIPKVYGCTDTGSVNYNHLANVNNGSCIPKVYGCTDTGSVNYNHLANVNNGSCIPKVYGCTDTGSVNYNHLANVNNGSCIPKVYGCTDTGSVNYNHLANVNNGSCIPKVYGCTDTGSINYNHLANVDNGSCIAKVYGIMDTACLNYNHLANVNSGSCVTKVYGIMDTACLNYNHLANVNSGSCVAKVYGIMDTACLNYNHLANVNSGSCVTKVYGIMDTACLNYNHFANVNSGSCVSKVYGIMDTACINYNPQANINSGTCLVSGLATIDGGLSFDILPNPFNHFAEIRIGGTQVLINASLHFYDVLGQEVDAITIPQGATEVAYINNKLAPGIYNVAVTSNGHIMAVRKVIVE